MSHLRNGIYGEIFFASAIAACFKYDNISEVINEALIICTTPITVASEAINYVLSLPIQQQSWDDTVDALYQKFGMYHWVHTINNAALICAALTFVRR